MKIKFTIHRSGIMIFAAAMMANAAYAAAAANSETEETQTISLADFTGQWESDGPAFGRAAHSVMTWEPVLGGKFMRLSYAISTADKRNSQTIFSGVGYYKQSPQNRTSAFWADSSGDLHPIKAELTQDTLMSTWGVAGGKLGRTYYKLSKDGKITVTDWLLTEAGWRQFNQNIFTRKT